MLPGFEVNTIFHVPYSGHIQAVTPERAKALEAALTPEVSNCFDAQVQKLIQGNIDFTYVQAAMAGGLLVRGANPQEVYDVAFIRSNAAAKQSAKILPFVKTEEEPQTITKMRADFTNAAPRYRLGMNFAAAARAPMADNTNFAPAQQMGMAA